MDDQDDEHWFFKSWRPAVAWAYLFLCLFDFFVAPLLLGLYCYYTHTPYIPWEPITTRGGSVLHVSMGGISGISAWSRGKEKIAEMENDYKDDHDKDRDQDRNQDKDTPPDGTK